jgi:hypothetical protein
MVLSLAGRLVMFLPLPENRQSDYLRAAFAVSFQAVRYGAAIMLAGQVLCGRPVDAANRLSVNDLNVVGAVCRRQDGRSINDVKAIGTIMLLPPARSSRLRRPRGFPIL